MDWNSVFNMAERVLDNSGALVILSGVFYWVSRQVRRRILENLDTYHKAQEFDIEERSKTIKLLQKDVTVIKERIEAHNMFDNRLTKIEAQNELLMKLFVGKTNL